MSEGLCGSRLRRGSGLAALVFVLLPLTASASRGGWTSGDVFLPGSVDANPGQIVALPAVTCPSAASCTSVGSYNNNAAGLVMTETAGAWSQFAAQAPEPADAAPGALAELSSVACVSDQSCTAVGNYATQNSGQPWLVTESGGKWSPVATPAAPNGASYHYVADPPPTSVSCASATDCVAVGWGKIILNETGGTWSSMITPAPANSWSLQAPWLFSVACPSVGNCVAVGTYTDASNEPVPAALIATETDGSWSALEAPLPADAVQGGANTGLSDVVCSSVGNCTAIGTYTASDGQAGLIVTESAGTWSATRAPLPANAGSRPPQLTSVACPSAGDCAVVGYYQDDSQRYHGLVLVESSDTWSATEAALPSSPNAVRDGRLYSIACPSATTCTAVGNYVDNAQGAQGLILDFALPDVPGSQSALEAPLPSDAVSNVTLTAIACGAKDTCSAVGTYNDSSNRVEGLLLTEGATFEPPTVVLHMSGRARARLAGKKVRVNPGITAECPAAAGVPCVAGAKAKEKATVVGKVVFTMRSGASKALTFTLNRTGLKLLRRKSRLTLRVTAVGLLGEISVIRASKTITIKRPRGFH